MKFVLTLSYRQCCLHSKQMTLSDASSTSPDTIVMSILHDCDQTNYVTWDHPWRSISNIVTSNFMDDEDLMPSTYEWYRFKMNGKDAKIPTSCENIEVKLLTVLRNDMKF